ncbi:sensor histidine kinase [Chitinophaga qingshengii]|uniref:Histidine kinase n=1 Tax=Chitinophaga qingshengii TaxID=1569794 RepID=A0ABR7TKL3_9BACT|nr:histidine kinase [Chitinophaga qingshengii]MBC9930027.1 histidine kinase [Chitinophaga qingshengii]
MKIFKEMSVMLRIQWGMWGLLFLLLFFTLLPEDGFTQAIAYASFNTGFYALVIYGNISFLYPRLWLKNRKVQYIMAVLVFLIGAVLIRTYGMMWLYNTFFNPKEDQHVTTMILMRYLSGMLTVFLLSFILRIFIAYFILKQKTEKMQQQHAQTELELLKSQVQPHFLFNTLNNIYYEAFREAPRTALLIERLSDIMRYFVDESPKDKVNLSTEIKFLENYIALEKIRIRHEIGLTFNKDVDEDCRIPPMLLMTFVENIFKHGIDKTSTRNQIEISLLCRNNHLTFSTRNEVPREVVAVSQRGSGIDNLRKRLVLLYGNNFELKTDRSDNHFNASLTVPL